MSLKFVTIKDRYLQFLRNYDNRIPNNNYTSNSKFFCGVVLNVAGKDYFAPVSSFNNQQRTNFLIKDGSNALSSIRYSFMFPVPKSEVQMMDLNAITDQNYKNLVNKELTFVRKNETAIKSNASRVYINVKKGVQVYTDNCCNFKILEEKADKWVDTHDAVETLKNEINFLCTYEEMLSDSLTSEETATLNFRVNDAKRLQKGLGEFMKDEDTKNVMRSNNTCKMDLLWCVSNADKAVKNLSARGSSNKVGVVQE